MSVVTNTLKRERVNIRQREREGTLREAVCSYTWEAEEAAAAAEFGGEGDKINVFWMCPG